MSAYYYRDGEDIKEAKDVEGKPRLTLVPQEIIWAIAEVREYGTKKYGDPDNWRKVDPQHYRDAAYRHWLKYLDDAGGVDEESGLPHLAHVATNVAFLLELEAGNVECDATLDACYFWGRIREREDYNHEGS